MAFNVRIMPVKVLDDDWDFIFGSPTSAPTTWWRAAYGTRPTTARKVLNMSFGRDRAAGAGRRGCHSLRGRRAARSSRSRPETSSRKAIRSSRLAEIAPRIDGAVSVGAVSRDRHARVLLDDRQLRRARAHRAATRAAADRAAASSSRRYDFDFVDTFSAGPAHIVPPRFDIFVYEAFQGTSMAAPHVSGFAALLMQQGITSPAAIEAIMKRYATDLGAAGRDNEFGSGLINPRAALRGMGLVR